MQDEIMINTTLPAAGADEKAIRGVVQALEDAWNSGDSAAWSAHLAADVHHTVWNGRHIQGRDSVTAGHEHVLNTVYKGTKQSFTVRWVRFLRPDVAAVQWNATLTGREGIPGVRPLAILVRQEDGRWLIAIFQNTPILENRGGGQDS